MFIFTKNFYPAACLISLILLGSMAILFYNHSESISKISNGLVICRSDCQNYQDFSDYFVKYRQFPPVSRDLHSGIFFRGYVFYVSITKIVFGSYWPQAYVAIQVLAMCLLLWVSSAFLVPPHLRGMYVLSASLLTISNRVLIEYQKTLLTDYIFAVGAALILVMLAKGVAQNNRKLLWLSFSLSFMFVFVRSNGFYWLSLTSAALIISYSKLLTQIYIRRFFPLLGIMSALTGTILVTLITAWGVERIKSGDDYNDFDQASAVFVWVNYLGEEHRSNGIVLENRLGTGVVNDPYNNWIANSGTIPNMFLSIFKKIPYFWEVQFPSFSRAANLYRVAYYVPVYALFLVFLTWGLMHLFGLAPDDMFGMNSQMAVMMAGYSIFTCALTFITLRYRVVFDVILVLGCGQVLSILSEALARRFGLKRVGH